MLEKIAQAYYAQGYNCAESIILAGNEMYGLNLDPSVSRAFSAFGGGLQCGELCGALVGACGVVGAKLIERQAHDHKVELRTLTQKVVREFEKELGARKCMELKPKWHNPDPAVKCVRTVTQAAIALEKVVSEWDAAQQQ